MFVHGNSLYRPLIHVPLIMSMPSRLPQGEIVHAPLNLRDLAATVLDLTGTPATGEFEGRTLRRLWDSTLAAPAEPLLFEVITTGKPSGKVEELRSVVWGTTEYIRHEDGQEELYDLARDEAEEHDLTDTPAAGSRLAEMRSAMDSILVATGEDRWPRDSE